MASVFSYSDYRVFLKDYIDSRIAQGGLSFRFFAKRAGISSPNYLQQVINGKRSLTLASGQKVAVALSLRAIERKYFLELVRLDRSEDLKTQAVALANMSRLAKLGTAKVSYTENFHSSWLHGVIWELASLPGFELTIENMLKYLGHCATEQEIRHSKDFLVKNQFLVETADPNIYAQALVRIESKNDIYNIELRRKHQCLLEQAIRNLELPTELRENQGLTISISSQKIPLIKAKFREFIAELAADLSNDDKANQVAHIELSMFPVTRGG